MSGLLGGYTAGPGYDFATGLGSVDAFNLASLWRTAGLASSAIKLTIGNNNSVH